MLQSDISIITVRQDYRGYPRVEIESYPSYDDVYSILTHRLQFFPTSSSWTYMVDDWEDTEKANEEYLFKQKLGKIKQEYAKRTKKDFKSHSSKEIVDSEYETFKDSHYPLYPVNVFDKLHRKYGEIHGYEYYFIHGLLVFFCNPDDNRITVSMDGMEAIYISGIFSQEDRDKLLSYALYTQFSLPFDLPYSPDNKTLYEIESERDASTEAFLQELKDLGYEFIESEDFPEDKTYKPKDKGYIDCDFVFNNEDDENFIDYEESDEEPF